jgi:hypothetical protein
LCLQQADSARQIFSSGPVVGLDFLRAWKPDAWHLLLAPLVSEIRLTQIELPLDPAPRLVL